LGLGFRILGFRFRVSGLMFGVSGYMFPSLDFMICVSGFSCGFGVCGFEFGV